MENFKKRWIFRRFLLFWAKSDSKLFRPDQENERQDI